MKTHMGFAVNGTLPGQSYFEARKRFSRDDKAREYPDEYHAGHRRDEREKSAILRLLANIPAGAAVLDFPCGSGRLTGLLVERGFRVRCADVSPGMLQRAERNYRRQLLRLPDSAAPPAVGFDLEDIMHTRYADGQFDAVICNRLFHHFTESHTRLTALGELRRICSGRLIISYFNSKSLDAYHRRFRNFLRGRIPTDRVPIAPEQFATELTRSGLALVATDHVWRHISPLSYVVARPV